MANIHFLPDDKSFECPENITILKTAKENNIAHANACGGRVNAPPAGFWC